MKTLFFLAFLAIAGSTFAQKPGVVISDKSGWHKITSTTVDFKKEREEVLVMGADRFASIKFKATDAPVDLQEIEVNYETGDTQKVAVRSPLEVGAETRVIDLKGGSERSIKKIVLVYKTLPNRSDEKAGVEIWGLKTNKVKSDSEKQNPEK